ncbi:similar to Saccharomyces cerevisiae YGR186W TFG1 TFIIF (Transcription Factor II) largest subunit [Maudiozyma barnettii]|uniref:Transcription initiation factor IIF subunit alpha n=1 Tax=Maudiozyma barnettii TaxID=61262 RepID=A0A8H2VI02_9SACH|nr:transcription factor IIF subunit TFG1 [Kazachstania barnettii]CAB4255765.1 similar to Saccharomyces cerevisiae YGR186W TFG1 TFIIF (Transcription Factor II) largest subunit [Kazachstania barnettii]CAD1784326.1 similar to Saccharomyces cerevisiae YGR186W TFG1 TFIIF (Transcription Factor II) largest subunit [Kazachstania barnettii]
MAPSRQSSVPSSASSVASGGGSSNNNVLNHASPFIKRDRYKRNLLRARQIQKNGGVKKEDPVKLEDNEKRLLGVEKGMANLKKEPGVVDGENEFNEFPLRAISEENLENIKTHLLKFQSKKKIDPSKSFHPPIRLHRKDTRNLQFQLTRAEIVQRQKEIAEYKLKQDDEKTSFPNNNKFKNNNNNNNNNNSNANNNSTISNTNTNTNTPTPVMSAPLSAVSTGLGTNTANPTTGLSNVDDNNVSTNINGIASENKDDDNSNTSKIDKLNAIIPMVTQLEEAGISEHPEKVGMVKYDGKEEEELGQDKGTMDPMADVAPDGGGRSRRINSKRKTRQLKVLDENAKKLRFEEFYPWVMEDYDGYNTWVGSYEAGNSDSYVLLAVENDGSFTMIPADKVYKFTARNKYATLTIDEAEKRMDKKSGEVPRWLMKHLDNIGTTTTRYDRTKRRLRAAAVQGGGPDDDDDDDDDEHDDNSEVELDYDEEFADDEEAPIIDGNEQENKESEQRIKKEMLQANAMGLRDDDQVDENEDDDQLNDKKIDVEGERIKKALQKTELAALYSSDEDEINPYLSESDIEAQETPEVKKEESENNTPSPKKKSPVGIKKEQSEDLETIPPKIRVKSIKDCIVVLQSNKDVLGNFHPGEWNPATAIKRPRLADVSPHMTETGVEIKEEEQPNKKVKVESSATATLITEKDIIDEMGDGKVNVKDFGKMIRRKYPGSENKKLMFSIVKKLCRKVDNEHMELKN